MRSAVRGVFVLQNCCEVRSDTHSTAAVPHTSQIAHCVRHPPYGGKRMEFAICDVRSGRVRRPPCRVNRT
eukprot:8108112-Lingulodinium_polyedra.AAC.1